MLTGTGSAQSIFNGSAMKPGDQQQACITVDYRGSLPANVRLYASVSGSLAQYLTTSIERGGFPGSPPPNGDCAGFVKRSSDGDLFAGKLNELPSDWARAIADSNASWHTGESGTYRITITEDDVSAAQGQSASVAFTIEARNA